MSHTIRSAAACLLCLGVLVVDAEATAREGATGAGQAALPPQLVISMTITDKQGRPVTDLAPGDFAVLENGQKRPILHAELDRRPVLAAVIVDSGAALSTGYQLNMVPAAAALLKALPPGTIVDLWTTGDRASHIATGLTDPAAGEAQLKLVAPTGGNALLDALAEASQALGQHDDHRLAVFVLTSAGLGDSGGRDNVEAALQRTSMRPTFFALEMIVGQQDPKVESALEYVTTHTAGYFDRVLSAGAMANQVSHLVDALNGQYRVAWQPGSDPRTTKLEFKVGRKGTKVVSAKRLSAAW